MPSPATKIDLKSWGDSIPNERIDDDEFNKLLSKYKSLYNEIRNYQDQHSDCSVSRASNNHNGNKSTTSNDDRNSSSTSLSPKSNGDANISSGNESVISLRKKFFQQQQQQDSVLPQVPRDATTSSLSARFRGTKGSVASPLIQHPQVTQQQSPPNANKVISAKISQHYNSSHNLTSSVSVDRPEIKQRSQQQPSPRMLSLSKSSERLDSIMNNNNNNNNNNSKHLNLGPSLSSEPNEISSPLMRRDKPSSNLTGLSNISPILTRGTKVIRDDDTIYDAVSPDDLGEMSSASFNERMPPIPPLPNSTQRSKLEHTRNCLMLNAGNSSSRLPTKYKDNSISATRVQPPSLFNDDPDPPQELQNNHLMSINNNSNSINISNKKSHNDNSSLSLDPNNSFKNQDYGNYVNIDFFLKRSQSPSFDDGLGENLSEHDIADDDDDDDDDDTTQLSQSLSTDQICEELKQLSPRDLARKLSIVNREHQHDSSASITPASSGDFLDDNRSPTATIHNQLTSTASTFSRHFDGHSGQGKFNSFFAPSQQQGASSSTHMYNHDNPKIDAVNASSRSSTAPRESTGSRVSLAGGSMQTRGLDMIQENQQLFHYPHLSMHKTIPSRQQASMNSDNNISFNRDSNQHLDHLMLSRSSIGDSSNCSALAEAHTTMKSFLSDLNLSPVDEVFEDKAQRRIVKESFAVEFCGRRKLRHLFLFNDVIVCAKYQASSKQKFTFDVKWYLNLNGVTVSDVNDSHDQIKMDSEAIENQILAIRTNLMLLRGRMQQIKRSKDKKPSKIIKKLKKKRTELEAELVLLLPHLPLVIKHANGKKYLFYLSSNFDRNQWVESIKYLQSQLTTNKPNSSSPSSSELQAWIQTCRKNLNPSLGTFLLRSNCDDDLLYGDLYINLSTIRGIPKSGHYYFCFEVDSYGHFSQKASSVVLRIDDTQSHDLNDEYIFPLDGAHTLRILLYEDQGQNSKPSVVGKAHVELSRAWCLDKPVERLIEFNSSCNLSAHLSYTNSELLSMRIPHSKLCPTFGLDITQVCKKEKTQVPLLIQLCVHEVERRGMREVGIYRMSGTSTDIQRLRKAFETNPYVAELLLRDIDINSVTGFLKQYLREMPEGLFINKLYPKFVTAFNLPQSKSLERAKKMIELFHKIPVTNQHTISYLVEHLVKVNRYENYNKMSMTNLATVLGPNILKPPDASSSDNADPFTAVVIGSMSQAGMLYFFLNRRALDLPLTELHPSELSSTSEA